MLLSSNSHPYNGKVFYIDNGQKRWVPSKEIFESYGFKWDDILRVEPEELNIYSTASNLPLSEPYLKSLNKSSITIAQMREIVALELYGSGIEFGAAASPISVPIHCQVNYADIVDEELIERNLYPGHKNEIINISFFASLDNMSNIENESVDFIISCHVIEHVRNPLKALEEAWKKLKPGGKFLIIVPHIDFTFDKNRELTTLSHIIMDYKQPSRDRDVLHFVEFFSKCFPIPIEKIYDTINEQMNDKNCNIHYHTWNENSFQEMLGFFNEKILHWNKINLYPKINQPDANEFYCILTK